MSYTSGGQRNMRRCISSEWPSASHRHRHRLGSCTLCEGLFLETPHFTTTVILIATSKSANVKIRRCHLGRGGQPIEVAPASSWLVVQDYPMWFDVKELFLETCDENPTNLTVRISTRWNYRCRNNMK